MTAIVRIEEQKINGAFLHGGQKAAEVHSRHAGRTADCVYEFLFTLGFAAFHGQKAPAGADDVACEPLKTDDEADCLHTVGEAAKAPAHPDDGAFAGGHIGIESAEFFRTQSSDLHHPFCRPRACAFPQRLEPCRRASDHPGIVQTILQNVPYGAQSQNPVRPRLRLKLDIREQANNFVGKYVYNSILALCKRE